MTQLLLVWVLLFAISVAPPTHEKAINQIPPDHAHIEGVVISLFKRENVDWASVKVISIKGYGSSFRGALTPNDTIEVKLPAVPNDDQIALSANQQFTGNIMQSISELMNSAAPTYEIKEITKY